MNWKLIQIRDGRCSWLQLPGRSIGEGTIENRLLERLSAADRQALSPHLKSLPLTGGESLTDTGQQLVYFPTAGLISIQIGVEGRFLEAAVVGREGMIGAGLVHARQATSEATVQVGGQAECISASTFRRIARERAGVQDLVRLYGLLCLEQAGQAIYAASKCSVEQRVARWILMAFNRLDVRDLVITHEHLANSLGVRRPGVTVALHVLEGNHAITANRGRIALRRLDRLRESAGAAQHDVFYAAKPIQNNAIISEAPGPSVRPPAEAHP